MQMRYKNALDTRPLQLVVEQGDESLTFTMTSTLDKSKKYDLGSEEQFAMTTAYINSKGEKYQEELFEMFKELYDITTELYEDVTYLFKNKINEVINHFDYDDMRMFTEEYPVKPPTSLIEEFDSVKEEDNIGTRIQTYTRSQYLDLCALTILFKVCVGPIGSFYINNPSVVLKTAKEHSLVMLLLSRDSWLRDHHTTKKLLGSFEAIVENSIRSTKDKAIILSKGISKDELGIYMLGLVYIKLIPVSIVTRDTNSANLITFIYSSTIKNIKAKQNVMEKAPLPDDSSLPESAMEILRMTSDEMVGHVEEFKLWVSDPLYIFRTYGLEDTDNVYDKVSAVVDKIIDAKQIDHNMVMICGWVLSITPIKDDRSIGFIRPEALKHFGLPEIGSVMKAVYMVLYYIDFKDIAELVISTKLETQITRPNEGRAHVTKETKAKLEEYYSLNTTVEHSVSNLLVKSINELSNAIASEDYRTALPEEIRWSSSELIEYKTDLRERLARMLLALFKIGEKHV